MAYDRTWLMITEYPNIIRVVITLTQDAALYLSPERAPIFDSGFPAVGSFPVTSMFDLRVHPLTLPLSIRTSHPMSKFLLQCFLFGAEKL